MSAIEIGRESLMRDGESWWKRLSPSAGGSGQAGKELRRARAFRPDAASTGLEGRQLLSTVSAHVVKPKLNPQFPTLKLSTLPAPAAVGDGQDIATGSDGNVWFTEPGVGKVGLINTSGGSVDAATPSGQSPTGAITAGHDGALWFSETNQVGRITTKGAITEYPVDPNAKLTGITAGPDGNVWFVDSGNQKIGRVTPSGTVNEFAIPQPDGLKSLSENNFHHNITAGPDGNVWFTTEAVSAKTKAVVGEVGKVTPAGDVTLYKLPSSPTKHSVFDKHNPPGNTLADAITAGPDGNIWFTEHKQNGRAGIGKITPDGQMTQYSIPSVPQGSATPDVALSITSGPDGNLWFNLVPDNFVVSPNPAPYVGRITPAGKTTIFNIPISTDTQGAYLAEGAQSIITGPDGQLWFSSISERFISQTGRVMATFKP